LIELFDYLLDEDVEKIILIIYFDVGKVLEYYIL